MNRWIRTYEKRIIDWNNKTDEHELKLLLWKRKKMIISFSFYSMLILPTPYDIDSLYIYIYTYTIRRIQPQIVYMRIQNNNKYQSNKDIACSHWFYLSSGNINKWMPFIYLKGMSRRREKKKKIKRTILWLWR